ncbi:hypothetical protein GF377_07310 [candidate division GN15 bacterium]|nr:hypothetical protein [candidate division GN15 bacterium]
MWSRSTSVTERIMTLRLRSVFCVVVVAALIGVAVSAGADSPTPVQVEIIYPKDSQVVQAVGSTFVLGNVSPYEKSADSRLLVNGQKVPIHEGGGFLAYLPVTPGDFVFDAQVVAFLDEDQPAPMLVARDTVAVMIPKPVHTLSLDSLQIVEGYRPPSGDLVLRAGEMLEVWLWGTPGCVAWFSVPGAVDSVPMVEAEPQQQPYWGEAVFGVGAVPESLLVAGIYRGFYELPESVQVVDTTLQYYLAAPSDSVIKARLDADPMSFNLARMIQLIELPDTVVVDTAGSFKVSLNHPDYPFTVRVTDSVEIFRHGPRQGYFSIFQPEGVEAMVVGREGAWYRARLSESQYAWLDTLAVDRLPRGVLPTKSLLRSIRTYATNDAVSIELPLAGKHPFRVVEDDARTLRFQVFGVTTDTDWIRYDFKDSLIEIATWSQPEPGMYELRLKLTRDLWGYDTYYHGTSLYWQINRPPERVGTLYGKKVVVDPGHSFDAGAIGPTGYTEAEANLAISLVLAEKLRRKGADVVMTRIGPTDLPLYDRPVIATEADADLFVSVHNNALPDGVNPFENNGTSSFYYHPHSMPLARAIHTRMVEAAGVPDHGLYHGNLAVNRPTQYPAVLVECTFMMLPEEEARLKTKRFRHTVSDAIVRGIEDFLEAYDDAN